MVIRKEEKRPTVSFRVNNELWHKIIETYGGYQPLEQVVEEHFLGDEVVHPSVLNTEQRIRDLQKLKNMYKDIYHENKIHMKKIRNKNKQISSKIKEIDNNINELKMNENELNKQIKNIDLDSKDKFVHSINTVTKILEDNKAKREICPTARIPRDVIKLYSDNCNMTLKKFISHLPYELRDCIN